MSRLVSCPGDRRGWPLRVMVIVGTVSEVGGWGGWGGEGGEGEEVSCSSVD